MDIRIGPTAEYPAVRIARHRRRGYRLAKRLLDLTLCILVFPLALPVMLLIAAAIVIDSPGPPAFVQDRIGLRGRPFKMYKFRSMETTHDSRADRAFMQAYISGRTPNVAPSTKAVYKPQNDSHIKRVGRFLRRTSLDELPQIINVLRGEMSLVGPRPNVPWESDVYKWWHEERLSVLPGITGLAQIQGRSRLTFDLIVRNDIHYVRNRSMGLDLEILARTVWAVLAGRGAA
jgi:lipopolysaccharide/colanic/teichoic acid biosynthesis glycosyltransferase